MINRKLVGLMLRALVHIINITNAYQTFGDFTPFQTPSVRYSTVSVCQGVIYNV